MESKGAALSDKSAKREYGVDRDFIIKGIKTGKLEYREGSIFGNPYLEILRRKLEGYIACELGPVYLAKAKNKSELRRINKEISDLGRRLDELQIRKTEIENSLNE
jgi:hypothetical protein